MVVSSILFQEENAISINLSTDSGESAFLSIVASFTIDGLPIGVV